MSSTKPDKKSKAYQLERIRNNQRRSRMRKQDHVAALEARIREYEEAEAQLDSQSSRPNAEERLQQQNSRLSRLLEAIGIDKEFQNAYLTSADNVASPNRPSLQAQITLGPETAGHLQGEALANTVTVDNQQELKAPSQLPVFAASNELDRLTASLPAISESASTFDEWMQDPMADAFTLPYFTPSGPVEESQTFNNVTPNPSPVSLVTQLQTASPDGLTPCSLAYSLVARYNRKGHSATYIDIRLYTGYRACALVGDGCAVEDKVLFGVLADVS